MYGTVHITAETQVKLAAVIWVTNPTLQAIPWFVPLNFLQFLPIPHEQAGCWVAKTRPAALN
jgi:hypothetical protein